MNNNLIIIAGMALVTYIPRMIPFIIMGDMKLPKKVDRFLSLIPFALLSALIFPGVFTSTGNITTALIGLAVCIAAALKKLNPTLVVVLGIIAVLISQIVLY